MLFLLFELGGERYALDVRQIAEVLPLVPIKALLDPPAGVTGVFHYRQQPIPVVDLSLLVLKEPTPVRISTRLVVVRCPNENRLVGLIAEHATDTIRREASQFLPSGVGRGNALSAGPVTRDERGPIQLVDLSALLPATLREQLFATAGAAG